MPRHLLPMDVRPPTCSRARVAAAALMSVVLAFPVRAADDPAATTPTWTRQAGGWSIATTGERAVLAQALSAASGTTLRGDLGVLSAAPALTLQLHGVPLDEAWRAVLGPAASYALQCAGVGRCRLWLLGVHGAAPRRAGEPGATARLAAAPPGLARAAADLRLPDPPGLFPSD